MRYEVIGCQFLPDCLHGRRTTRNVNVEIRLITKTVGIIVLTPSEPVTTVMSIIMLESRLYKAKACATSVSDTGSFGEY